MRYFVPSILFLTFLSGCGSRGVKFDPDFHVPSLTEQALVNERGERIYFLDHKIESFACMSEKKVGELKDLLLRASSSKSIRAVHFRMGAREVAGYLESTQQKIRSVSE